MNRGALKIIGFCLAALLLAGVVQFLRLRAENQRVARDFVESVASLRQRQTAQNTALQARFNALDLDHALEASTLASTDGVHRGRELLANFRALLAERERLAAEQTAAGHKLIEQLPAGRMRDGALRGAATAAARTHKLQDDLSRAETANADAIQAILDWAERNHARLHLRGDKLMVDGQRPLDELKGLESILVKSGQDVQGLLAQGHAIEAKSGRELGQLQEEVRQ
jgi:hypothetical protein